MLVAEKLEDLRFTSDLEKNWAQSAGLVELFFIIIQLQIHKHHDQVLQYQNGSNAARGSLRLKVTF